eukprot:1129610-Prymnesium_polylepis.1
MLSMFLAILAEGQVKVRDEEETARAEDPDSSEYGVLSLAHEQWRRCSKPLLEKCVPAKDDEEEEGEEGEKRTSHAHVEHHDKVDNHQLMEVLMALRQEVAELREIHVDKASLKAIHDHMDNMAPLVTVTALSA